MRKLSIGEVYQIKSEILYGEGAQDKDGQNLSPFTMGWLDENEAPYTNGVLLCPYDSSIQKATGMTSLMSHGEEGFIRAIKNQDHGQIENMEGAPFFYISLIKKHPFSQLPLYIQPG